MRLPFADAACTVVKEETQKRTTGVDDMAELNDKRVAFLATDGVEQVELTEPWKAVKEAGGAPQLISIKSGKIQGMNHDEKADTFKVDKLVDSVSAEDYDGLVLPGGVANPDTLRVNED